jgi:hypothetical protein
MTWNQERIERARKALGPPPSTPREWRVFVRLDDGVAPSEQVGEDAIAEALCPPAWYPAGAIYCSRRDATVAPTWTGWSVRITYWPAEWAERTTLHAPPAIYAAAQIAGLRTRLDGCLVADHDGIQYFTPGGRPIARQCFWDGREHLPADVLRALDRIRSIDRLRAIGGHMRGRPDTPRAAIVAAQLDCADRRERAACCELVKRWLRALPCAQAVLVEN